MPAPFDSARLRTSLLLLAAWVVLLSATIAAATENVLTNAAQVRNLTVGEASQALPVRIHGVVVTEADAEGSRAAERAAVIADDTAGIYVLGPTNIFSDVHRGELLDIVGVTDPGEFAPIILVKSVHYLATTPLPTPLKVTFQQMIAGTLDGQLVEVSGVVRSWEPITATNEFGKWHMELAVGDGRLTVSSNGQHPAGVEQDAEVRVQGVCFYQFNDKRQVISPLVLISRDAPIHIEKSAPADPFNAPVRAVSSLLQFSPSADYQHRVHVRGIVTFQQRSLFVWLRDQVSGLRVQTHQSQQLQSGDDIDVVGYVRYGAEAPVLEDAVFQRRSSGSPPQPMNLTRPDDAFDHQEDLVSIDAILTDVQPVLEGWSFTFQDQGTTFKAILRRLVAERVLGHWQNQSRVRVSGICLAIPDDSRTVISGIWHPRSFQILLRSPDDLMVITPAPWWTPPHIILLFAVIAGASLLVTALVMLSARRRLREQAIHRAMAETEFAAILSERNRVAREIHDTLAQGLAATSVQLTLAKKNANGASESLNHHLEAAHELVRESLAEARDSIWNMRSHVLESSDLAGALREVLKQRCDGTGIETNVEVSGRSRRLAPILENNLLRIGQEAIFNATKHAKPKHILVKLEFGEKHFRLAVQDDGCGLETNGSPRTDGGFGLTAMRERATELKGELKVGSVNQRGTEILVTVPLSGE